GATRSIAAPGDGTSAAGQVDHARVGGLLVAAVVGGARRHRAHAGADVQREAPDVAVARALRRLLGIELVAVEHPLLILGRPAELDVGDVALRAHVDLDPLVAGDRL